MKKIFITIGIVIIVGILYFLLSPLFINTTLDEMVPTSHTQNELLSKEDTSAKAVNVIGSSGHPASGQIKIITDNTDTYIRYENFKTINGPDIYVYLAKDLEAKEYINLGKVKATEGNVNYQIPANVNVKDYRYVMVWCKTFGVLFNYADISNL